MQRVQSGLTAGIAIVAASAIAVTPVTAPAASKVVETGVTLLSNNYDQAPQALLALSSQRIAEGMALSGLNPAIAALAIATGDRLMLSNIITASIDAPLWAIDPALEAIAQVLPRELGGGTGGVETDAVDDGALLQFRNVILVGFRDALSAAAGNAIGQASNGENPAALITAGLAESATNLATSTVLGAAGLSAIAEGLVESVLTGDNQKLYLAARQYIDAPLWIADPAIDGFARALSGPDEGGTIGGTNEDDTTFDPSKEGALMAFRTNVLWANTNAARTRLADALGVDPNTGESVTAPATAVTLPATTAAPLAATVAPLAAAASTIAASGARTTGTVSTPISAAPAQKSKTVKGTRDVAKTEHAKAAKTPGKRLNRLAKRLSKKDD